MLLSGFLVRVSPIRSLMPMHDFPVSPEEGRDVRWATAKRGVRILIQPPEMLSRSPPPGALHVGEMAS